MSSTATTNRPGPGALSWHRVGGWDNLGLLLAAVVMFVCFSLTAPNFLTTSNLLNVLQQTAFFGIIAYAMTLVIVAGEIDISVGSQAALSSALLGVLVAHHGWPMWLACLAIMLQAVLVGALAGWIRARWQVPSFIITLALYMALRGLAMMITDTYAIPIDSGRFFYWGDGKIFGQVPVAALYMLFAFAVFAVLARFSVFGRSVYAVGGNPKAAHLSGIRVQRIRIAVLALTGLAAAVTGLLQSAQLSSGTPTIAVGLEFDAIAAAIIGGTSLSGGRGTVVGTFLGVIFVAMLANGMVLLGVDPYAQNVVRGGVVLLAVLINVLRSERSALRT
ncbi:ABC transporter permease [Embleya scabrispora]|uniref:ABC transporter permease n=1 Tax=Embleya scabrispora TaxID=159449 RepID=UPI00036F7E51|nr:ABC transporter permease [Embleya scabrispora]MYS86571.1 ABC transporter permease [Streptomyces sp. SID5474]